MFLTQMSYFVSKALHLRLRLNEQLLFENFISQLVFKRRKLDRKLNFVNCEMLSKHFNRADSFAQFNFEVLLETNYHYLNIDLAIE